MKQVRPFVACNDCIAHTIALGKSVSISSEAVVVHSLDHHSVPVQIVSNVIIAPATPTILQAIDLLLPVLGRLLRFGEFILELFDFSVLLSVACLLLVLLALIRNTVIQAH
jgi:hypothetical protein